jgi:multiple sugar transport system ATP-binding protein
LESISSGAISLDGRRLNDVDAPDRDLAMVFQSYALYPHWSVYDNLAFPLKLRHVPKAERQRRILDVVKLLHLEEELSRKPGQLSGGQRQRVAMGRAIIRQPKAYLMDEPLSNLDAQLRAEMRMEIAQLQRRLGVTTIYVTHDQLEALALGDRMGIMRDGKLLQVGTPQDIYDFPADVFVASFVGSPGMALSPAIVRCSRDGGVNLEVGKSGLRLTAAELARQPGLGRCDGMTVVFGVRPENVRAVPSSSVELDRASDRRAEGVVADVERIGADKLLHLELDGAANVDSPALALALRRVRPGQIVVRIPSRAAVTVGDHVAAHINEDSVCVFDGDSGIRV